MTHNTGDCFYNGRGAKARPATNKGKEKENTEQPVAWVYRLWGIPVLPATAMLMEVAAVEAVVVAGPLVEEAWIGQ